MRGVRAGAIIFVLLGIGFVLWQQGFIHRNITCRRCNIVIIVVDSLRADALPCYGYTLNSAPHLCGFSKKNILFTNMYANSTWTRPSNMSIITSLYPISHGLVDAYPMQLNPQVITMPQALYRAGYTTTLVTNDQPNMEIELGFGRGFEHITLTDASFNKKTQKQWLETIDAIKEANRQNKPAFVYMHTDHVHDYVSGILTPPQQFPLDPGYTPSTTFSTRFTPDLWKHSIDYLTRQIGVDWGLSSLNETTSIRDSFLQAKTLGEAKKTFDALPDELQHDLLRFEAQEYLSTYQNQSFIELSRHLYDETIRTMDIFFGDLFTRFEQQRLLNNTIVVIVSDHGQLLGEENLVGHILGLKDEEIHVPFIMHVPGQKPARLTTLTQLIDIYPTIFDLVGIPLPQHLSGISLRDSMMGIKGATENQFVISHTLLPSLMYGIQTHQWRLVEADYPNGIYHALYDTQTDPKQTVSVAQNHQPVIDTLTTLLHRTIDTIPRYQPLGQSFFQWYNQEDRLRKIHSGYFFNADHQAPFITN